MIKMNKKIFGSLFFSIFAATTGVGIVLPLLPVYGRNLGASGLYIGFIFGVFSLSRTFFLPYFGSLSDKKGRKLFIVAGLFLYSLLSLAFMFSNNIDQLLFIRFIQGIASAMIIPVAQAYIGEITPNGKEGLSMGLFNMSIFLGLSVGPLIGGLIKDRFGFQISFACMGFLAFIGFLLSFFLLPPTNSEHLVWRRAKPITWSRLLKDNAIAGLFMFRFAYTICIGVIWGFLPVFADSEFSISSSTIGTLLALGVLINGLMNTPMGFLSDRVNKKLMIISGGLIAAYAVFSFARATDLLDLFVSHIIFGFGGGISMPPLMALAVLKGNKSDAMGSVMALMTMAHSLGMLLGAILAGLAMDIFHLRKVFPLGAILMVIGVGVFYICTYDQKRKVK